MTARLLTFGAGYIMDIGPGIGYAYTPDQDSHLMRHIHLKALKAINFMVLVFIFGSFNEYF